MYVHQALRLGSDPQPAIPITEYPSDIELPRNTRERIGLGFSVNESMDSAVPSHQECAVSVFT